MEPQQHYYIPSATRCAWIKCVAEYVSMNFNILTPKSIGVFLSICLPFVYEVWSLEVESFWDFGFNKVWTDRRIKWLPYRAPTLSMTGPYNSPNIIWPNTAVSLNQSNNEISTTYIHTCTYVHVHSDFIFPRGFKFYFLAYSVLNLAHSEFPSKIIWLAPLFSLTSNKDNGCNTTTRGATVTGCAPVVSFSCKGLH